MGDFDNFFDQKYIFFEILVLGCLYGSNTLEKVKTMLKEPFPMI